MATLHKLEVLKDTYSDEAELDLILGKLLDITLSQYRLRLERYERDLREFEERRGMESATFYRRFEAGELGDAMDFFEWAGLYELCQDIIEKIQRLEPALKSASDYLAYIKALIVHTHITFTMGRRQMCYRTDRSAPRRCWLSLQRRQSTEGAIRAIWLPGSRRGLRR